LVAPSLSEKKFRFCPQTGRVWKKPLPRNVFVPERIVVLNTPPPVRPISAS
jgi:hypothetical protein